jgi:hypothetical protein
VLLALYGGGSYIIRGAFAIIPGAFTIIRGAFTIYIRGAFAIIRSGSKIIRGAFNIIRDAFIAEHYFRILSMYMISRFLKFGMWLTMLVFASGLQ